MNLSWVKYNNRYRLLLYLGEHGDSLVCIESHELSTSQAKAIAEQGKILAELNLKDRLNYIDKEICHIKNIVKTFKKSKTQVLDIYPLGS